MAQIVESPITMWRRRYDVTQSALARRVGLSRPQLSRVEAGMYETLPELLTAETGVTDETYQRFRNLKRRQFDLSDQPPLDPYCSPKDFTLWRQTVAWNKFLAPGAAAFASAICLNVGYIQTFEKAHARAQLPPSILAALTACGAVYVTAEVLELRHG